MRAGKTSSTSEVSQSMADVGIATRVDWCLTPQAMAQERILCGLDGPVLKVGALVCGV